MFCILVWSEMAMTAAGVGASFVPDALRVAPAAGAVCAGAAATACCQGP